MESKTVHNDEEDDRDRGKRSKKLSELKQVEIISKNLHSFLEITHVQKEALPSHKL